MLLVSARHQHESAIGVHTSHHSWTNLPPPTPSPSSRLSQSIGFLLPASNSKFPLPICFTYGNIYVSILLSQFVPAFPSLTVSRSLFSYVCLSIAALQMGSSVPSFQTPYICINMQFLFFCLWLNLLCIIGSRFIHLIRTDSNVFLLQSINKTSTDAATRNGLSEGEKYIYIFSVLMFCPPFL